MMRFARVASGVILGLLACAASGQAQTPAATADTSRVYVAFDAAATFGHKSSGSVGAEGGYVISGPYSVFVEGGRMMNVGSQDLDDRAARIANALGGTFSASYKVNYFDAGIRIAPEMYWPVRPYFAVGFGVAQVRAETAITINGTTVGPETILFGSDLNGTEKKPFFMLGGGASYPFAQRFYADFSLRYGRIFPKTDVIDNDKGINTLRAQVGVGVKF